jgi:hypothetical protein
MFAPALSQCAVLTNATVGTAVLFLPKAGPNTATCPLSVLFPLVHTLQLVGIEGSEELELAG